MSLPDKYIREQIFEQVIAGKDKEGRVRFWFNGPLSSWLEINTDYGEIIKAYDEELEKVKAENERLDSELNRLTDEVAVSRIELEQALGYLKRVLDVGLKLSIALDIERFLKRVEDDSK